MSKEMEILDDIAEQNDTHGNRKQRPAYYKGSFFRSTQRGRFFGACKTGQLRRKPKVSLAGRAREEERGQG